MTLVFLDDEPDLCDLYESLFANDSRKVVTFTEPEAAINYFEKGVCDFCFIDYHLGSVLGTSVRESLPDNVKCVLVTGEAGIKTPEGFIDVLEKPFDFDEFDAYLEKIK